MKIKGMNRNNLLKIRNQINLILELIEEFKDIKDLSNEDIIRSVYLEIGNINEVLEAINAYGLKIKSEARNRYRVYNANDISEILISDKESSLGKVSNNFFNYNKKRCSWTSLYKICKEIRSIK
ncbi:hypothetical protein [Helicovermis profundi]|uniref:Uncharacterized protein n=1 Tax=Helicovermis profundi TaxID=3065157 RepID=A0AAU9E2H0_9FIRM|nr:hypothetical protein HLPR_11320 [Clostridia bacterium S502]